MLLDFFPSRTLTWYLGKTFMVRILAVLIIAFFYSGGLDYSGFVLAGVGIALVLGLSATPVSADDAGPGRDEEQMPYAMHSEMAARPPGRSFRK